MSKKEDNCNSLVTELSLFINKKLYLISFYFKILNALIPAFNFFFCIFLLLNNYQH